MNPGFERDNLKQHRRQLLGKIEHHVMSTNDGAGFPPLLPGPLVAGGKWRALAETGREDVGEVLNAMKGPRELDALFESRERLRGALCVDPCGVARVDLEDFGGNRRDFPTV